MLSVMLLAGSGAKPLRKILTLQNVSNQNSWTDLAAFFYSTISIRVRFSVKTILDPDIPKKFLDRIKFIVPILSVLNR